MRKLSDSLLNLWERGADSMDDWDEYEVVEVDKSGKVKTVEPPKKAKGRPVHLKKASTFNVVTDSEGEGSTERCL